MSAGRGDVLLEMRDGYFGRGPDGRYNDLLDANITIRCMDDPRRTSAENTELARGIYAAAPFLDPGRPVAESHHECEAWPEPPTRTEPWLTGDVAVPPTLTVSVTGDPATPNQGGVNLARALGGGLLTVDGNQHGISLLGQSACVDDIVTDHLIELQTPPADARCTL